MNGPIKMYRMKPVVLHDFIVELPKCMYKIKNVHHSTPSSSPVTDNHVSSPVKKLDIFEQVKQFLKNCQQVPGMADLETKQNEILEQLAQLKRQIYSLKKDLNIENDLGSKITPNLKCSAPPKQVNNLPDSLVISANPSSPPYSLLLLQRLLQDQVGLSFTSYLHSSVTFLPELAKQINGTLQDFKPQPGVPVINVKLIWKNISSNAEIVLSHIPVAGEVNLLRYLTRVTNSRLGQISEANFLEIDSLLDQCHLLVRAKTKTEKAAIKQILVKSLNKSDWLAGSSQVGIADLAAYSAIKQTLSPNEISANLEKWYGRCERLFCS